MSISADDEGCDAGVGDQSSASLLANETALYVVNPASNTKQQSFLRLINVTDAENDVEVYAIDDEGRYSRNGPVSLSLAPNASKQITAQDLEDGNTDKGLTNDLCDGQGKWQLRIRSAGALEAMSLIRTPDGFLTSLSDPVP